MVLENCGDHMEMVGKETKMGLPFLVFYVVVPLLKYLLQYKCRDVLDEFLSVPFDLEVGMFSPPKKLLLFPLLFPQEKLALPSCHLRLALIILHSCKVPS
jgi:hypothetical protein